MPLVTIVMMMMNKELQKIFELVVENAKANTGTTCFELVVDGGLPSMYFYVMNKDGSIKKHCHSYLFGDSKGYEAMKKILQEANT